MQFGIMAMQMSALVPTPEALGKGDLDVARLLDRLVQANWNSPIIFELSREEDRQSLDLIRSIRPQYVSSGA